LQRLELGNDFAELVRAFVLHDFIPLDLDLLLQIRRRRQRRVDILHADDGKSRSRCRGHDGGAQHKGGELDAVHARRKNESIAPGCRYQIVLTPEG
jgi:hypothetical protein